ncbi:MAG: DUF4388 domain-containing protein [Armatimonadota bacterium]
MALTGSLADVEAADVIQLIAMSRKTGVLTVVDQYERSLLYFDQGQLIHAVTDNLQGNDVVYNVLAKTQGDFAFEATPVDCPHTVTLAAESLMLEGAKRMDDWERLRASLPAPGAPLAVVKDLRAAGDLGVPLEAARTVVELTNGGRTLEALARESGLPEVQAYEVIGALIKQGVISAVVPAQPAAPEPAPSGGGGAAAQASLTAGQLEQIIQRVATL